MNAEIWLRNDSNYKDGKITLWRITMAQDRWWCRPWLDREISNFLHSSSAEQSSAVCSVHQVSARRSVFVKGLLALSRLKGFVCFPFKVGLISGITLHPSSKSSRTITVKVTTKKTRCDMVTVWAPPYFILTASFGIAEMFVFSAEIKPWPQRSLITST